MKVKKNVARMPRPVRALVRARLTQEPAAQRIQQVAAEFKIMTLETTPSKRLREQSSWLLTLLGIGWLVVYTLNERFWTWFVYSVLPLQEDTRLGSSVHFFLTDTVKISLLLVGVTFVVTMIRTFITIERTRALLGGKRSGLGNVLASLLGIATPFCSCSAVPVFIGFVSAGIPLGVTMSFLIASPLINEVAVVLLFTMFGFKIAAIYVVSGLTLAIGAGYLLGKLRLEKWVEPFVLRSLPQAQIVGTESRISLSERFDYAREETRSIYKKVWPYLLVGIALGAIIHGWVPTDFFVKYAGSNNPFGVLLAVAVGIPLYSNAAGVIPIVSALYEKGLPMGTLLAFMMSVVALSLPEMILLKRVLKPQLLVTYVAIVGSGIVLLGYAFNFFI